LLYRDIFHHSLCTHCTMLYTVKLLDFRSCIRSIVIADLYSKL
jgi:hypothetical protein